MFRIIQHSSSSLFEKTLRLSHPSSGLLPRIALCVHQSTTHQISRQSHNFLCRDEGNFGKQNILKNGKVFGFQAKLEGPGFFVLLLMAAFGGGVSYYWCLEQEKVKNETKGDLLDEVADSAASKISVQKPDQSAEELATKIMQNRIMEKSLKASLHSAIEKVHLATEAKYKTVDAVNEHIRLMKLVVDENEKGDWSSVTNAFERADEASRNDAMEEKDARNYLDNVRKIIEEGEKNEVTCDNPLLKIAHKTVDKLAGQLDEMNLMIKKTRDECRILSNDLIDKSRRQFASELKSVLPDVDFQARELKLSEDDLNLLIAHLCSKIDQLRQELTEQRVCEKDNTVNSLEEQKKLTMGIDGEEIESKMQAVREETRLEAEKMLAMERELWEAQMEDRLQRVSVAHSQHLDEIVRTQRILFEIEMKQKIEEAITEERCKYGKQLSTVQSRLEHIETVLKSQASRNVESRRGWQIWMASLNLIDSVIYGHRNAPDDNSRRKPLANEFQLIREANSDDPFVACLVATLPDETVHNGVYTEEDLKIRFNKLCKVCRRVARMDENCGIFQLCWSFLQNVLSYESFGNFSKKDKFDPLTLDSYEILSRAKSFVSVGDFDSAVRMLQLLTGPARCIARDWIHDARAHLEVRFVAELLLAHAVSNYVSKLM